MSLVINPTQGPSRCVSNVQDINSAFAHAIEDPIWIANHGYGADLGSLRDSRRGFGDRQMRSMTSSNRRPMELAIAGLALAV